MRLTIIAFTLVQADIEKNHQELTNNTLATRQDRQRNGEFNTGFHSNEEITKAVPEFKHRVPDIRTEHLSNWIRLVAHSQHIDAWHELELSNLLTERIISVHRNCWLSGQIGGNTIEDLDDLFPLRTRGGMSCNDVFGSREWFLRLDFCSTKDAQPEDGKEAKVVNSVRDVLRRLITSKRAVTALEDHLRLRETDKDKAKLFLLPFRMDVDLRREYRVFCPPSLGELGKSRIAAVSQYRFTEPFSGEKQEEEVAVTAQRVLDGILETHRQIVRQVVDAHKQNGWIAQHMKDEGFVFDVFEAEDGEVQLVEVNPFGAMSGCGSGLFHWIRDGRVLYGVQNPGEIEFRVTLGS